MTNESGNVPQNIVVYLPFSPEGLPILSSLYVHAEMMEHERKNIGREIVHRIQQFSPCQVMGRLPDPQEGKTVMYVCHSRQTVREAVSLAKDRPMIVWAWLLDEQIVAEAQEHLPVVFGAQNTPGALQRSQRLVPSQPDPDKELASVCYAVEHGWGIPEVVETIG